ncbi:MAG TPA: SIMPL domain-containing protein [Anaerolineales bacterium]|nr:SIMPL domain-containing protein [Anaerolineales bacterium]
MKTITYLTILFASVLIASFTVMSILPNLPAQAEGTTDDAACNLQRIVNVNGNATVYVVPDRARIRLAIETSDKTPKGSADKNTALVKNVFTAIRGLGIAPENITTDQYRVYPDYSDYDTLNVRGYHTDNIMEITLQDIGKASPVLVAALTAGATRVESVDFYSSELRKYRDQAREMAVTAAKEKANALTATGGGQVGCLVSINEVSQNYGWGSFNSNLVSQNTVQSVPAEGSDFSQMEDGKLALGQIAITAQVSVSYAIR